MYIWVDGWVHVNCAFWAFGVYDNSDGTPAKVHQLRFIFFTHSRIAQGC